MFHSVGVEIGLGFSFSALILWGLWSVSYKLCSQRFGIRFELFFVNWVLGGLLQATLLAVLFGNNFIVVGGEDQQQFFSNLFHTSVMPVALCSIAGILAVMGNYLLLASTELTGLSVAVCPPLPPFFSVLSLPFAGLLAWCWCDGETN